jgi:hypothetical protein
MSLGWRFVLDVLKALFVFWAGGAAVGRSALLVNSLKASDPIP